MKKIFFVVFSVLIGLTLAACQSKQEELYRQAEYGSEAAENSSITEKETSSKSLMLQSRTEEMYRQDPQLTPEPGDTLTGELHIKTYRWRSDPPEIYWLAREFMELHPNVKIDFDYSVGFYEYKSLSYDQKYQLEKKFYDQVRLELASGEADYILHGAIDRLDYYQMMF